MPDAPIAATPPPQAVRCCDAYDGSAQTPCALCSKATCKRCRGLVNARTVCPSCLAQIERELGAEKADASSIPGGIVGGLVGAVVGGGAWALVAIVTGLAIGYVAIGVGFLAGLGVLLGAKKKKSVQLQVVAVACALLGLFLGKYFIVAHFVIKDHPDLHLSFLDGRLFRLFVDNIGEFLRPFDILWILLALGAASRATRPTSARLRTSRTA